MQTLVLLFRLHVVRKHHNRHLILQLYVVCDLGVKLLHLCVVFCAPRFPPKSRQLYLLRLYLA